MHDVLFCYQILIMVWQNHGVEFRYVFSSWVLSTLPSLNKWHRGIPLILLFPLTIINATTFLSIPWFCFFFIRISLPSNLIIGLPWFRCGKLVLTNQGSLVEAVINGDVSVACTFACCFAHLGLDIWYAACCFIFFRRLTAGKDDCFATRAIERVPVNSHGVVSQKPRNWLGNS